VVLPLADRVVAVPLPPAPVVAPQPRAPLRPLPQAEVVPAARVHRVRALMWAMARQVPVRSVLARRAHQVPRRWVPACHGWVRLALARHWALHLRPARRRCRAPQPPGRRQPASLVELADLPAEVAAVAERRLSERAALHDPPLAEPEARQVATGMPHLSEASLPAT